MHIPIGIKRKKHNNLKNMLEIIISAGEDISNPITIKSQNTRVITVPDATQPAIEVRNFASSFV